MRGRGARVRDGGGAGLAQRFHDRVEVRHDRRILRYPRVADPTIAANYEGRTFGDTLQARELLLKNAYASEAPLLIDARHPGGAGYVLPPSRARRSPRLRLPAAKRSRSSSVVRFSGRTGIGRPSSSMATNVR